MSGEIKREDAPKDDLVHDAVHDKKEAKKVAAASNYHGQFEKEAFEHGRAIFQPLTMESRDIHRATGLTAFSTQYEIYKLPIHQAQRALGRVNDLRAAGAPRTPAEIDAKTAEKFKKLDTVGAQDAGKQATANQWIEQQEEMEGNFEEYMLARESVQAAVLEFKAAQEILRKRALEAKKAGKESEKAKIDQAADTLVEITHVAMSAGSALSMIEGGFINATAGEFEETTAWSEEAGKEVETAKLKRESPGKKAFELAKAAAGQLSLKNIFIAAMGDSQKYLKLMQEIAKLEGQIKESEVLREDFTIDSAKLKLDNVKISVKTRQGSFESKRATNRDAAQTFGQAMGGREGTINVALMAEAYQELDLFAPRALEEANQLHGPAIQVWNWLLNHEDRYKVERSDDFSEFAHDVETLVGAVKDTEHARKMLQTEVPIWTQTAGAWKGFLTQVMGKPFDKDSEG